jgi:hypothetical protein
MSLREARGLGRRLEPRSHPQRDCIHGLSRPFRWLYEIYLERCFLGAGLASTERLPVPRELGETSFMFLLHSIITPEEMVSYADADHAVVQRARR